MLPAAGAPEQAAAGEEDDPYVCAYEEDGEIVPDGACEDLLKEEKLAPPAAAAAPLGQRSVGRTGRSSKA